MDCRHYITDLPERKRGQHLQPEERGAIQALKRQGLSNRAIARELGCSPTTIGNELRRGTPPRKSSKGRAPGYALPTASLTAPAVLAVWQSSPAYAEQFLFMRVSKLVYNFYWQKISN